MSVLLSVSWWFYVGVAFYLAIPLGGLFMLREKRTVRGAGPTQSEPQATTTCFEVVAAEGPSKLYLTAALCFLPPSQRARYAEEWAGELYGLDQDEALQFSLGVLQSAPKVGLVLLLKRVFGRRTA
ncbi:hypothetical protein ACFXB3_12625 [Streptomyces sp. NPDC059447]|uniref:hypothetical protein n=1 Tax=Streptomyces sp. NPDC059447 TaxID=3346834 RepID=UPI00369300F3